MFIAKHVSTPTPAYDRSDSSAVVLKQSEATEGTLWLIPEKFGTCGSLFRLALDRLREVVNQRAAATKHEVLYDN
jgi:hypothetical protein